jgi:transcriptional regulator with XRE-family HTH domain
MNKNWPQQDAFRERVREYCEKNGYMTERGAIQIGVVADLFGLAEITLKQFLQYRLRSRPHYDTLAYIAGVVGCSVTEFMDDPGGPPPVMPIARWTDMSQEERAIASELLAEVGADDLTLAEKEELLLACREANSRLLRMRTAWRGDAARPEGCTCRARLG